MFWTYYYAAGREAAQPNYYQFQHGDCLVGCGPVAWAILFCWADYQAETGNSYWAARVGLFRECGGTGTNAVAPLTQTDCVENVIREIHDQVHTFCWSGQGATAPWDMGGASEYLSGRTGTDLTTHYNSFGWCDDVLRIYAQNSIRDRGTPAVIGTGWLSHYPVAYGYAWRTRVVKKCFLWWCWYETVYDRWFIVNPGQPGGVFEWVPASTWFAGEIYP